MVKLISESIGTFSRHYPRLVVIVTAHAKGKDNAMTAAWHSPISLRPPLYGVSIAPRRFTYELIAESKAFGINFLPLASAELFAAVGGISGQMTDKFEKFNITRNVTGKTDVPVLADAYATYECRLVDDKEYGDHRWLVGEIVATHWQDDAFTENNLLDLAKIQPSLYLGSDRYLTTDVSTSKHIDRVVKA